VVRTADAAAQAEPAPAPAAADVAQAEPAPAPAADVGEAKPAPAPILAPPPALRPADAIPVEHRTTVVDAGETLGHFADWLEVPTQRLRTLNRLSHRRSIHEGQRLRLDFSRVTPETFTERRLEHHKAIEEDFFGSYRVTGTVQHTLERGENAWTLAHQRYSVPVWLLERHNPGVDLTRLAPGAVLTIPVVESAGS
jgi:membrane-bound lytic murein transglycosylase D